MSEFQEFDAFAEETGEQAEVISSKKKTTAGLLAIFLGVYGVDLFYLGKVWQGILSIGIMLCYITIMVASIILVALLWWLIFPILIFIVLLILLGAGVYTWPLIRAIKAFKGKAKDKSGALVKE